MSRRRAAVAHSNRTAPKKVRETAREAPRARREDRRPRPVAPVLRSAGWTEMEQAFFDAAPPDHPETAGPPETFDDLGGPSSPRQDWPAGLRRTLAAMWARIRFAIAAEPRAGRAVLRR